MKFEISDTAGYTLAKGSLRGSSEKRDAAWHIPGGKDRGMRDRIEAERIVARIDREFSIKRMLAEIDRERFADRGPRTATHPVARREPAAVFELPERRRAPSIPMATPVRRPASAAAVAAIWIIAAILGVMLAW